MAQAADVVGNKIPQILEHELDDATLEGQLPEKAWKPVRKKYNQRKKLFGKCTVCMTLPLYLLSMINNR